MAVSQNGYPAYNNTSHFVRGNALGFGFWAADNDVRVIFEDLVTRFNATVEAVAGPVLDDWSWANRNVRGSDTQVSNHASATAIDLNALKHPRGVKGTYTAAKKAAVRKILARYGGVVRWGEDYVKSPVDGMHFEIVGTKAQVKDLAESIRDEIKKAQIKAQEEDVEWTTKLKLSDSAVEALNKLDGEKHKAGEEVSIGHMLTVLMQKAASKSE